MLPNSVPAVDVMDGGKEALILFLNYILAYSAPHKYNKCLKLSMSKVGGRGQTNLLSGSAYSHHINRLMNYVAVSCGACDHDTMTILKSEELIQATLHFG